MPGASQRAGGALELPPTQLVLYAIEDLSLLPRPYSLGTHHTSMMENSITLQAAESGVWAVQGVNHIVKAGGEIL